MPKRGESRRRLRVAARIADTMAFAAGSRRRLLVALAGAGLALLVVRSQASADDAVQRVLITFANPAAEVPGMASSPRMTRQLDRLAVSRGISAARVALGRFRPKARFSIIPAVVADLRPDEIERLRTDPAVATITPNWRVHKTGVPNRDAQDSVGVGQALVDFTVSGGLSVPPTIATIDTGFNPAHEALAGKLANIDGDPTQPCYAECTSGLGFCWQSEPEDLDGHGTHVAGIALGAPPPPDDVYSGVCPACRLASVKALDDTGNGYVADVVAALDWVVKHRDSCGIRVVNLSLASDGCGRNDDPGVAAANRAVAAGIVVVVAAGNAGPDKSTVGSPGAASNAITVGSVADDADPQSGGFYLSGFSSRGPTCGSTHLAKPDLLAPGERIVSADAANPTGYIAYSGTSMATPFISGLAGLMLLVRPANLPALTPAGLKRTLVSNALAFDTASRRNDFGAGLVDGYRAIAGVGALCDRPGGCVATHRGNVVRLTGSLRPGKAQRYRVSVADGSEPFAATLIFDRAGAGMTGALQVYDGASLVESSSHGLRQEQLGYWPPHAGPYDLVVNPISGTGRYRLYVWTAGTVKRFP